MDKKLSVAQRTTAKTGWDKSNQFSGSDIKDIKVFTGVRNDKSLNAIPSPLARMHLFEAAFDLLDKDENNGTNYAGDIYKKIISDCFDVFELVYNWNNHLADKQNLSIVTWNKEKEIAELKGGRKRHQLLGETLEIFLNEDALRDFGEFLIFKIDNKVIAGTSPFTGFFTTPNNLYHIKLFNPTNNRSYFSKIIPFKDRRPEIKKYIYDFFFRTSLSALDSTQAIRDYLSKYADGISPTLQLNLQPLKGSPKKLFNETLKCSSEKTLFDYFEKTLIKVNYRLNDECFYIGQNEKTDRKYDFLLPLTPQFFVDFKPNEIPHIVRVEEMDDSSVSVTINKDGLVFSKKYQVTKLREEDGELIDLDKSHAIKINLGIFPFIKVVEKANDPTISTLQDSPFNDFYKIMLVCQDNKYRYSNENFKLSFFINNYQIIPPTNNNYITEVEQRTILERDQSSAGSTYYTLKGKDGMSVCFDYMQLELPAINKVPIQCAIVPKWRQKTLGMGQVDYAIDFGTTTTFIAYTNDPDHEKDPRPFSLDIDTMKNEKDFPVAMLNQPMVKTAQFNWIDSYEQSLNSFIESIEVQKQEFLPSLINKEKYHLPFRTVMYEKEGVPETRKRMFANANISYIYQKQNNFQTHLDQRFVTNLKWNVNTKKSYEELIKIFIEQIFHMLRLKTILRDADPRHSRVCWFSPLSFTPEAERGYETIWKHQFTNIFKANADRLSNITESEAPYYYYEKRGDITNIASVLTMDIGGGTTDIMYIKTKPLFCSSVYFGANVLWGNGFNELFLTAKDNGIYKAIRSQMISRLNATPLKGLNDSFTQKDSNYSSDEIINFWILNNDQSDVLRELNSGAFRLTYLLHFTALIYHSYKILRSKGEKMPPTCIIFSGNGSKYLDLIQSEKYIVRICAYFATKVFGVVSPDPQVILPDSNRKEATCYGGLYQPFDNKPVYEPVNYIGFDGPIKSPVKYGDIDLQKEEVFKGIENSFEEFINHFFNMTNEPGMSFRTTFGIDANLAAVKSFLLTNASSNLEVGYTKRRKTVQAADPVTDTLFFNPLIGLLYRLNKLTPEEISAFVPKSRLYAVSADASGKFAANELTFEIKGDSIFMISVDDTQPNVAEITVIQDPDVFKRALGSIDGYLKPVCHWEDYPATHDQPIKILSPGHLIKVEKSWVVERLMEIEFIINT